MLDMLLSYAIRDRDARAVPWAEGDVTVGVQRRSETRARGHYT